MPSVLVVDSECHMQRLVSLLCTKSGYTSVATSHAEEALGWLKNGLETKVILLDIILPGMDGFQFLRCLKQELKRPPPPPVILLTSLTQENIVLQGIRLGAVGLIRKPFQPDALLGRLASVLAA